MIHLKTVILLSFACNKIYRLVLVKVTNIHRSDSNVGIVLIYWPDNTLWKQACLRVLAKLYHVPISTIPTIDQ